MEAARADTTHTEPRAPSTAQQGASPAAAVLLADEEGVESLSMRRLGLRLGVEAMSLYNHVANKDDILDGMVDLVVSESNCLRTRSIGKRPCAAGRYLPVGLRLSPLGERSDRFTREQRTCAATLLRCWGTLRRAGFTLEMAARAFSLLDSYIYGFGRQQLNVSAGGNIEPEQVGEGFLRAIPADEYPYLMEMVVEYAMKSGHDEGADFEFGLNLILDGLQTLLDRKAR